MRLNVKKVLLFLVATFALHSTRAQVVCTSISMPDSAFACNNDTVSIQVTTTVPNGLKIIDSNWTPKTGIDFTSFYNPIFAPGNASQTYTINLYSLTPADFVQDGNFDSLNTNNQYFSSSYRDTTGAGSLWPEGYYSITSNPTNVHPLFSSFGDHTTGTGNMMVINGAGMPIDIWCETISVTPNTYYDFSAWAASCAQGAPAVLQFKINGVLIDSPLQLPNVTGLWTEFHALWYSDTFTSITICINDQQTALGGNDFAIDDISFKLVCHSAASVFVAVPDLNDSLGIDKQPCQNGLVTLSVINRDNIYSNTAQYTWNFGDKSAPGSGLQVQHTYNHQSYYLVSVGITDHTCADSLYGIVYVNNFTPHLPIIKDTAICAGASASLWVGSGDSYQWSPATGLSDTTAQNPIATPRDTTTYYVVVHTGTDCVFYDTVTVAVRPLPVITASPTDGVVTCASPTLQLQATGAQRYVWSPGQYVSDPLAASPFAIPEETTTYVVTGLDAHGCVNKDSVTVQVPDVSKVYVPSAFTPNGDGKNDVMRPVPYCGFRVQEFSIFNRWGERVYYSDAPETRGWDGTINGTLAPIDTYFYVLVGSTKYGVQKTSKGNITLIR